MTAHDLFTIVKPLIGTEWEPEGLNTVTMIYCAPGEELQSPVCLPVPAARAMWEVALTGCLFVWLCDPKRGNSHVVMAVFCEGDGKYEFRAGQMLAGEFDVLGSGPTRLHALVAAAEACKQ